MCKKYICLGILFLISACFVKNTAAYNDKITHPDITVKAAQYSQLELYLKSNLGFKDGLETKFSFNSENKTILYWLREGAELEDDPNCRASNHFHNPLKAWGESYMTDDDFLSIGTRHFCPSVGNPRQKPLCDKVCVYCSQTSIYQSKRHDQRRYIWICGDVDIFRFY